MNRPAQEPDLIKVSEIFLVPSSFLVAALGTADTNMHRACVSVLGLIISVLWWSCSSEAYAEQVESSENSNALIHGNRARILYWLPVVFVVGWFFSLVCHGILWNRPLGVDVIQ